MHETSRAQFDALAGGSIPPLEQVRDDVWSLPLAMPAEHIPFSLAYLLRDAGGGFHVIDPGWDSDENWNALVAALVSLGAEPTDVVTITGTHMHHDHVGMAHRLARASGATFQLHREEHGAAAQRYGAESQEIVAKLSAWAVPEEQAAELLGSFRESAPRPLLPVPDRALDDDELLDIPGFEVRVMLTPGHTPGHICLRDDKRSLVFSGDHVLPTIHAGLGLGGPTDSNPLADYLAALERVAHYPQHEVLPGHGYRFSGLAERATQSAKHHLRRSGEVSALVAADPYLTVWKIASQLTWTAGWENLRGFHLRSALSQTEMHRDYVTRASL